MSKYIFNVIKFNFQSFLSSCSLLSKTFLYMFLKDLWFKWNKKKNASMNHCSDISGRSKIRRGKELQINVNSVSFSFLFPNTELVKVSAARVWANLHWHRFKRALPVLENGGDKSVKGALALCTLSPATPLSLGDSVQWPLPGLLLSALRVMPPRASSVVEASVRDPRQCGRSEHRKCKLQHYFLDTLSAISDVCQALTRLSTACVTVHTRFWLLYLRLWLRESHLSFHVASFSTCYSAPNVHFLFF